MGKEKKKDVEVSEATCSVILTNSEKKRGKPTSPKEERSTFKVRCERELQAWITSESQVNKGRGKGVKTRTQEAGKEHGQAGRRKPTFNSEKTMSVFPSAKNSVEGRVHRKECTSDRQKRNRKKKGGWRGVGDSEVRPGAGVSHIFRTGRSSFVR